ncbi:hypothetical protein GIB67_040659 [Kingdonia uniflora]|uniref:Reverse transcriptase domain-containing protein n=1 Tax=Kingdonia uniflora TaxID=39325 RepID=A0A7J7KU49_9MAGN|nr:hypothetical protein GIB67_040659 [Kingdonia uniflora]
MVTYKSSHSPSHLLFADDIFIFAKSNSKGLKALKILMEVYQSSSRQWINKSKCKLFAVSLSPIRLNKFFLLFGFGLGSLLENYLGIPLVQDRVSKAMVAPLIDKIMSRDSGWSRKILSFESRIVLVKSILTRLPIYNMAIYKWPIVAIQEGERIIRNFLWSGDPDKQKFVTIKWNKVCKHPSEGGIGIHGLRDFNLSMLMKLGWGFLNAQDPWATFLRAKFFTRGGLLINYNKYSSIWNSLKEVIVVVQANSKWIIGSGRDIDFGRYCWGSEAALIDLLNIQPKIWKHCTSKLVIEAAELSANCMSNNNFDLANIVALGVLIKARPLPRVQSCTWALPWFQEVKINVGAVAMGSPGTVGTGVVARNHYGEVIGTFPLYRLFPQLFIVLEHVFRIMWMVIEEKIASKMQRLKLKYFGDHSLEMMIPAPIPLTYQGLSEEEAVEAEEDFYYKLGPLHLYQLFDGGGYRRSGDGSGGGGCEGERQKIRGFDKELFKGDKRLKGLKDSGSLRWLYSSIARERLDATADSHSDTEGRTWNDNTIWVKGNCLRRDEEEPLNLRFRTVKKS